MYAPALTREAFREERLQPALRVPANKCQYVLPHTSQWQLSFILTLSSIHGILLPLTLHLSSFSCSLQRGDQPPVVASLPLTTGTGLSKTHVIKYILIKRNETRPPSPALIPPSPSLSSSLVYTDQTKSVVLPEESKGLLQEGERLILFRRHDTDTGRAQTLSVIHYLFYRT